MARKIEVNLEGYAQQVRVIRSKSEEIAFVAGVRAGKTHVGAQKMIERLLTHPGASAIVTAPSYRVMEVATLPTYDKVFPAELIKTRRTRPYPVWGLHTGGQIHFFSTDKPEMIVGFEVAFVHMDEASLSPYAAYVNCKKRMSQRDKNGKAYPHQLWVTTTPRQLNWIYNEFGPDAPKEHELIQASTRDNVFRDETDIEEYIRKLGLSETETKQEIEGNFEILAGDCLFRKDSLDAQLKNCIEAEARNNGWVLIYKDAVVGARYVAGADCADARGDFNNLVIQDTQTGDEVAEIYTDAPADKFALMCFDLLGEYGNPVCAPERNGTAGGIVIQKLRDLGYPNLYKDDKQRDGWYTSTSAIPPKVDRYNMLKEYEEAVRLRQTIIRSFEAIGEMSTFIKNKLGKYEHLQGRKDDRVMARAITWQVRKVKPFNESQFISVKRLATSYA